MPGDIIFKSKQKLGSDSSGSSGGRGDGDDMVVLVDVELVTKWW